MPKAKDCECCQPVGKRGLIFSYPVPSWGSGCWKVKPFSLLRWYFPFLPVLRRKPVGLTHWLYCQDDSQTLNFQCFRCLHRMRALGSKLSRCFGFKKKRRKKKKGVGGVCVYKANQIRFNPRLISDFYVSSDTSSCSPVCLEAELQDQSTVFPGGSVAVDLS